MFYISIGSTEIKCEITVKYYMQESERNKLIEIIEKAITINGKLLDNEKKFIEDLYSDKDSNFLEQSNEILNELSRKESLYLGAAKHFLQKINKK